MSGIEISIFVICTIFIVQRSWSSLLNIRSHGFYRFFGFEIILVLILLNNGVWFHDPFSPVHIVSWVLLFSSLFLAIHGFRLLKIIGKPQGIIEDTTTIVTVGAYRYIRHPLYGSLLLLAWGAYLKDPLTIVGVILVTASTLSLVATAKVEERENIDRLGSGYADYMKTTKMFIPFIL